MDKPNGFPEAINFILTNKVAFYKGDPVKIYIPPVTSGDEIYFWVRYLKNKGVWKGSEFYGEVTIVPVGALKWSDLGQTLYEDSE